jgi:hypothetical protein
VALSKALTGGTSKTISAMRSAMVVVIGMGGPLARRRTPFPRLRER